MDGFHYYNLFETKGIEYILTIVFFLLLIPYWMLLNRKLKVPDTVTAGMSMIENLFRIPQGLYYSLNHTWVQLMQGGERRIGIDDLLTKMTGNVDVEFMKQAGEQVRKGEVLAQIGRQDKKLKVFAPISGTVSGINPVLVEKPKLVPGQAFDAGWLYEVKPDNWTKDAKAMLSSDAAQLWFTNELSRLKEFFALVSSSNKMQNVPIVLQDGGELKGELLAEMPQVVWEDFQKAFASMAHEN